MTIDKEKLKLMAEHAVGFTDMSLAPDVILELLAEIEHLTASRDEARELRNKIGDRYDEAMTEIAGLRTGYDAQNEVIAGLRAENNGFREMINVVIKEIPHARFHREGNAPGHSHSVPGIWDEDNGAKAGTECGWCKVWNSAVAMSKGEQP